MATDSWEDGTVVNVLEGWRSYFGSLMSLLEECRRHWELTESIEKVTYFCEMLERFVGSTERLRVIAIEAALSPEEYDDVNARECSILALCLEKIVGLLKDSWLPYWRDREEALRKSHISSFGQLNGCVQMIHTGVCVCGGSSSSN